MDVHFHLIFRWKLMNSFQQPNTWTTAYSFWSGQNTHIETKSEIFDVMSQRRKVEQLYCQVLGLWKHPESWNSTVYGWKTKPASFEKKIKLKLQALIHCLSAMQIAFTTNNYFITLAVFNFKPKKVPQTYHNNSHSKGAIEVEVSIFWKIIFHNLIRVI